MSQPMAKITHASVCHGCRKKRWTKKRVSTGTLPYQITRYCDQKKYIHMIDIANCSLATSCTAAGGMAASPRSLPGGTVSRRIAAANAKHTTNSNAASTSVRPKKNVVLSHAAFTAIGCETHE